MSSLIDDDHLYCGTRHGEIVRFFAPDYKRSEVFAQPGGFPLGLAFDAQGTLLSCVGAMGLYAISKVGRSDAAVGRDQSALTALLSTTRVWALILTTSMLAPDGKIYFTTDGCVVTFRTLDRQFDPVDFEAPPFFRPVWFPNIVGVVLDEAADWDQLAELLKVSYRVLAPKALNGATR